jgi:hypothetical protein
MSVVATHPVLVELLTTTRQAASVRRQCCGAQVHTPAIRSSAEMAAHDPARHWQRGGITGCNLGLNPCKPIRLSTPRRRWWRAPPDDYASACSRSKMACTCVPTSVVCNAKRPEHHCLRLKYLKSPISFDRGTSPTGPTPSGGLAGLKVLALPALKITDLGPSCQQPAVRMVLT